MSELDKTCWCTHSGHDHDAGECWAEVTAPNGSTGQCACNWWEPTSPAASTTTERTDQP